jgi:hypothetical protein
VSLQTPPGRGSWDGCLEQSGAASQDLLQTGCLGWGLEGCLEQLPRKLLQTAPDCTQTGAMVWSLPPDQTAPGASPCCQEVKQGVEVRWGEVERLA